MDRFGCVIDRMDMKRIYAVFPHIFYMGGNGFTQN